MATIFRAPTIQLIRGLRQQPEHPHPPNLLISTLAGQSAVPKCFDWPAHQRQLRQQPEHHNHPNLLIGPLAGQSAIPTSQEWPEPPRRKRYPAELRHMSHSVALSLLGKDQFFGAPGQGPNYDWPNPSLRSRYPSDLRTWLSQTNLSLMTPPVPTNIAAELINQGSINNYEPRSIAMPGTINVGGGFQL